MSSLTEAYFLGFSWRSKEGGSRKAQKPCGVSVAQAPGGEVAAHTRNFALTDHDIDDVTDDVIDDDTNDDTDGDTDDDTDDGGRGNLYTITNQGLRIKDLAQP